VSGAAGVSHLLAADDALLPGRWGAHIALCGQEIRGPSGHADEDDCCPEFDCDEVGHYCAACVREAVRFSAEADDRVSGVVDQVARR
jgi:hypothetical protein